MEKKSKHPFLNKIPKLFVFSYLVFLPQLFSLEHRDKMEEVFSESCWDCHDEDLKKGGVQLDDFETITPELFDKAFRAVRGGSMPPAKKKQLTPALKKQLLNSLSEELESSHPHDHPMRRMTKNELIFSLEDLFGIKLKQSTKDKISEEQVRHGFDVSSDLGLTDQHLKAYLTVIRDAVDQAFQTEKVKASTITSTKFIYEAHAKRPKIIVDAPQTLIAAQPRTANGTSFPYFRNNFICQHEGWYDIAFTCEPQDEDATIMLFAGTYYQDGALVFNRPSLLKCFYIDKKQSIKERIYLKPEDEIAFSAMRGTKFIMQNPVTFHGPILESYPSNEVKSFLEGLKVDYHEDHYLVLEKSEKTLIDSLRKVAKHALRKKIHDSDLKVYFDLAVNSLKQGQSWLDSYKLGLSALLCSPDFLVLDSEKDKAYLIAERLSFMLWKSLPDQSLLKLASTGELLKPEALSAQYQRMIKDPKSNRFIKDFSNQWMDFKSLNSISADYRLYPEYDIYLRDSMIEETHQSFSHYLHNNQPLKDLIDSDYIFINEKLAKHYNLENIKGTEFRKIMLPKTSSRGGLMTQASLMMSTSDGAATTPVKRGIWILEHFLNRYVPAAPKNVPGIEADIRGEKTILEQLALHRDNKDCRSCHVVIDAYGVAFENFDPIGQEREHYRTLTKKNKKLINFSYKASYGQGDKVVSDYDMPNGEAYLGIQGFKEKVMQESYRIYTSLAEKFMSYAKGRHLSQQELLTCDQLGMQAYHNKLGMKDFLQLLISSPLFKQA